MTQLIIKNATRLRRLLWIDAALGGSNALAGLFLPGAAAALLGFSKSMVLAIAAVTLLYGIVAFMLALKKIPPAKAVAALVAANWAWTSVSVTLFILHYRSATPLGIAFLIAQIIVVGGLAYLEGAQLRRA